MITLTIHTHTPPRWTESRETEKHHDYESGKRKSLLLVSALKVCVCVLQNVQLETIISLGGRSRSGREGRRRRGFRFPSAGCRAGVMRQWFCLLAAMTWLQQSKGVQSVAPPHSREQPRPTLRAPPPAVNPPPRSESLGPPVSYCPVLAS